MIAERLVAGWVLRGQLLVLAVGLGVAGLAELVERSRSTDNSGYLAVIVLLRVLLLARELLPVLLAVGLALALAWRRQTGELLGLAAAGFPAARLAGSAALASGALGIALATPLELAVPAARDRLVELSAGQSASVEGHWILTEDAAVRVGRSKDGVLRDVSVVPLRPSPPTHRFELETMTATAQGWRSEGVRAFALGPDDALPSGAPPLPSPALLTRLGRATEPVELGAFELLNVGQSAWRDLRFAGIFAGFVVGLAASVLTLGSRLSPAPAAAAAGLGFAAWRTLELSLGAGAAPMLALLLIPLLALFRNVVWEQRL